MYDFKISKIDTYDFEIKKIQIPNSDRMAKFNTTINLVADTDLNVNTGFSIPPRMVEVYDSSNVKITEDVYQEIILTSGIYYVRLNSGIDRNNVTLNVIAWAD
jgi:hypothetical protein